MCTKAGPRLFLFAGILWLLVGLRDAFAPGFFSMSGRVVTGSEIALDFAMAAILLTLGGGMGGGLKSRTP